MNGCFFCWFFCAVHTAKSFQVSLGCFFVCFIVDGWMRGGRLRLHNHVSSLRSFFAWFWLCLISQARHIFHFFSSSQTFFTIVMNRMNRLSQSPSTAVRSRMARTKWLCSPSCARFDNGRWTAWNLQMTQTHTQTSQSSNQPQGWENSLERSRTPTRLSPGLFRCFHL